MTEAPAEVATEAPTEAPAETEASFAGPNSFQVADFSTGTLTAVNFTLPESMWVVDAQERTLYLYNVESLDVAHSAAPRIQFETRESREAVDVYAKDMTELTELESRMIGGVEMQGRTYKLWGMAWTEYYGEMPGGLWMTVKIAKTAVDEGSEGSAILDSVTFA